MARTDVRSRMVSAGEDLLAERGYGVTMLDVIERAEAPRGSIYYHFPDGKNELAIEVAHKVTREVEIFVAMTAEKIEDPVPFLQRLLDHHRKRLTNSDFDLGCPMMGIVVTGDGSAELDEAVDSAFTVWISVIAKALRGKGFTKAQAEQMASLLVTGIEGCIVVSRGRRTTQPFTEFSRTLPLLVRSVLGS